MRNLDLKEAVQKVINQHTVCHSDKEESHNQHYVIFPFDRNEKITNFLDSLLYMFVLFRIGLIKKQFANMKIYIF